MIEGVGCDMIEIERIKKSCTNTRFVEFVYSNNEIELFAGDFKRLAGNFAAKEAFGKALGTGVSGFLLSDVSVLRDERGRPYYKFEGAALEIIKSRRLTAHLSLTNTDAVATAFVVLEKNS